VNPALFFDTPAQPKEKSAKITNTKKIPSHFFILNNLLSNTKGNPLLNKSGQGKDYLHTQHTNIFKLNMGIGGAKFKVFLRENDPNRKARFNRRKKISRQIF